MPPRKKVVRKTVRKAKPKAQPQSPPPPPSPEPEPEQPASAVAAGAPDAEETLAAESASNNAAAAGTVGKEPEPEVEAAAEKTLGKDAEPESEADKTLAEEPACDEAPVEDPAATSGTPAAEAGPSESGKRTKVVKKVVVKKIIKRKVLKPVVAERKEEPKVAEEDKKVQQEDAAAEPTVVEEVKKVEEEDATAVSAAGEQPSEDALAPVETVTEAAVAVIDSQRGEDAGKDENVKEEEELGGDVEMEAAGDEEAGVSESAPKEVEMVVNLEMEVAGDEEVGALDKTSRKKTEIFVGGLDRDVQEEDLRKVFGEVGEIIEVRMIMDGNSGKNKGYAFVRYADASKAKKAVSQFEKVEIRGKLCGASALKGNDTIFLGNIDKKWKKEDIIKLLQKIGVEKIEAVTVMPDLSNAETNRGFAFLELETNKDAQSAFKKLQQKDAFGQGLNVKVSWAEPLNDPDEEEMKKVKSVYAEGIPATWNEEKVRDSFKKFGKIERIVLARNIKSSRRKDFAFVNYETREAALSCIESFDKEELTDGGSKVNVKVSLAKPVQKGKQNKGGPKPSTKGSLKDKPKAVQRDTKPGISSSRGKSSGRGYYTNSGDVRSTANYAQPHAFVEQSTWNQGPVNYARGPTLYNYTQNVGEKRPISSLGDEALYSNMRGYPRARSDGFASTSSSYAAMTPAAPGLSNSYYQRQGPWYQAGARYSGTEHPHTHQVRQGAPPYSSNYYSRYG